MIVEVTEQSQIVSKIDFTLTRSIFSQTKITNIRVEIELHI